MAHKRKFGYYCYWRTDTEYTCLYIPRIWNLFGQWKIGK